MNFYCQLNYAHIPYPAPEYPQETLADSGCDPCCAAMVVESLSGTEFSPEQCADLAKVSGAREGFGTDMAILAPAIAQKMGICYAATESPALVKEFLETHSGLVIANTVGDRDGWIGVFSDSRHYVVLADVSADTVAVWDPMLHPGRYDVPGRAGKVRLEGTTAYADFSVIVNDCIGRPYYLFWKPTR